MPRADDIMLTAEELRLRQVKRRRILLIVVALVLVIATVIFARHPIAGAIKAWQSRRHAARVESLLEKQQWTDARNEALAAYQLQPNEPEAIRAVARYLSRTRQHQALEFWEQLAKQQALTREDLRDEATVLLVSGEIERATPVVKSLIDRKDAGPSDWFLATQLALQKSSAPDAQRALNKIFDSHATNERETLQAALLELQATNLNDPKVAEQQQANAWSRIKKLAEGKTETALSALVLLAQRTLGGTRAVASQESTGATDAIQKSEIGSQRSEDGEQKSEVSGRARSPSAPQLDSGSPPTSDLRPLTSGGDIAQAIEAHPLAKAPQKFVALDLQMHADPSQKEACIERAITQWKDTDVSSLVVLATWLNGHGEFQRALDTIPLERSLHDRNLFLARLDALGALGRWSEIKQLLNSERFPLDPVIQQMYLARSSAQLGEKTAAENNWQRALEAAGGDVDKLLQLGNYAEKNGMLDVAEHAYDSAVSQTAKLRDAQQGRLRIAQAQRDTRKIHTVLAEMLKLWPNDTAIQNDEAYTRLLLISSPQSQVEGRKEEVENGDQKSDGPAAPTSDLGPLTSDQELTEIEKLAEELVRREPASLPHRTLLALALLKQERPVAALDVYANINVTQNALSPSALAVHAAVLAANDHLDDARNEIQQLRPDQLLPEEQALISTLL
jgi:tetratricopeptide (TPR) repeat protein